jgi:phosphoglycolate phosphatase
MMHSSFNTVIFDLDGTLIDSSASIIESLNSAFLSCQIIPKELLNSDIIGPPLMEILTILSGTSEQKILNNLANEFKSYYDNHGYKKTIVFPGVIKMLKDFKNSNLKIYIATNKRIYPTNQIIDMLNWGEIFNGVYALDSIYPKASSKGHLLTEIIEVNNLIADKVVYIGDREDDYKAAIDSGLNYKMATWGYAAKEELQLNIDKVDNPITLSDRLLRNP